jgi:hypothetical protein
VTSSAPLIAAMSMTLAMSLAAPASADEITDQLDAASAEYESGELRKAAQTLQFAIASIQEKINLELLKLLPEPLEGWRADDPQAQSAGMAAMITGTNLTRRYFRDDGAEVEIGIMADSPLMPMMTMMLSNPMMMQTNPDNRIYNHAGHRGMIEHAKDGDSWKLSLLVANKILVKIDGSGVSDQQSVEDYLKAIDLDAVQKAFGG